MSNHDKIKEIFGEFKKLASSAPHEEQEKFLLSQIEMYSSDEPDDKLGLCALYSQLGGLYRAYAKLDEGEKALLKAKELLEEIGDERSFNYVTVLNNLAGLYHAAKKYELALETFDKSIALCENGKNVSLEAYSSALNNKGLILQEQGKYNEAEKLYNRALGIIKHIKNNSMLLATTYSNLAFVRFAANDKETAVKHMDAAIALFESGTLSTKLPMYMQCKLIRGKMAGSNT